MMLLKWILTATLIFNSSIPLLTSERLIVISEAETLQNRATIAKNALLQGSLDPETIKDYISARSEQEGVNPQLALKIAEIESNFNPRAKSKTSSASGIFQFVKLTFATYCFGDVFNPIDNTECALKLLKAGQIGHWLAEPRNRKLLAEFL